jgi:translation initiation factor IF-2
MSKKRVHEIARELKAQGIELDNKEVVNELVALGYDVKSHSSSLEDDQANAAILKIISQRKPKAPAAPVTAKGFVVRRKIPGPSAVPGDANHRDGHEAEIVTADGAPGSPLQARSEAAESERAPAPVSPVAEAAPERPTTPAPRAQVPSTAQPEVAPTPSQHPVPPVSTPAPEVRHTSAPRPIAAVSQAPTQEHRPLRPTATQAVVISRPLVQVRRVTPTSAAHKNIPLAPGKKAIGEVREFKVVPDHLGRGRELVDVTKNKSERGKKRTSEKESTFSKQEMVDLAWGRVTIPLRGKKKKPTKKGAKTQITEMAEEKKVIKIHEGITVSDMSQRIGVKNSELIKKLMTSNVMATANQMLDAETAAIIASDYGWKVEKVGFEVAQHLPEVDERPEDVRSRPPVVTVMGHVDHGKTSLLDYIRHSDVAAREAGGITQHIGAYTVHTPKGDITFLDTPGHEAFTSMRARGANVTDIVVLVVAADDGVMPQTIEAINHAKAAEVPIVVAINKIDTKGSNPELVKKGLANHGLVPEEWGGDTIMVPVSAKTGAGIDLLLENILLQAEVLELSSNPNRPAVGAIIEAKLDKGRGPVASVLVSEGTLRVGDAIVSGVNYGKVRAMTDDHGEAVEEVGPGFSAEVVGLSGVPSAGDTLNVVADEKAAKEIADHRTSKERQSELGKTSKESLEALLIKMKTGEAKELRVVLKGDVQGSVEAISQAIDKLSTAKVKVEIIHKGVGAMTETDVMLAAASKGIVVGFNVKPESGAEATAKHQGVAMKTYSIIYELLEGVRQAMEGMLEPIRSEKKLGRAEVRNLFNVPRLGTIAGAAVIDGTIKRTALIRLLRDNKQVYAGRMASLKRFKDDVREVAQGFECGIGIENYSDMQPGDIIEAYEIEETRPSLT